MAAARRSFNPPAAPGYVSAWVTTDPAPACPRIPSELISSALYTTGGYADTPSGSRPWSAESPASPQVRAKPPPVRADPGHQAGSMIADAVRYMSVHSWKQPDSHGRSGTSQPRKQQPREAGDSQLTGRFCR